jgi:hypothetical protein
MAVIQIGPAVPLFPEDDAKAIQADAARKTAANLLNEPTFAARLTPEQRAALQRSVDKLGFDLAVYRGELFKQLHRGGGAGVAPVLATTTTQNLGSAETPFGVLVGLALLVGAALGAMAALSGNSTAAQTLDNSLSDLSNQTQIALSTVPRPLSFTPIISKDFFDELVRLGILIVESSIVSIDFTTMRKKIVQMMQGIEDLMKQNQNPCDDFYVRARQLALQFFAELDRLPANDNDGGQAVFRLTNLAIRWMKAVNDLFECFNIEGQGPPFPKV